MEDKDEDSCASFLVAFSKCLGMPSLVFAEEILKFLKNIKWRRESKIR